MKKKQIEKDLRVKVKRSIWLGYALTYFVLLALSTGEALVYELYSGYGRIRSEYILESLGYWAIVSAVFSLIINRQKIRVFDKPMRKLSEAAKQVAAGDFSVYLEPLHTSNKADYIDVMFEDFNKMVEELGSIETLKNDFIAAISHEIKTPLSVVQSYAAALQNEDLSQEDRKEYIDTIISASKKLTALTTNILKLNKLENQKIPPVFEPLDLCRQLCDCALSFEDVFEQKGLEFSADIEDRSIINTDASILEIVWQNLLSNASKFTGPGGKISLTQKTEADSVVVSVSDTGCGMDKETVKRVFDKFYQGDAAHFDEGNGLGLTLALRVVDLLGGSISVKSGPGKGSTFIVRLKIRP